MKYHLDKKVSAYIAGAVYDVSMVLSPFLGGIIVSTIPKERELFREEMSNVQGFSTKKKLKERV